MIKFRASSIGNLAGRGNKITDKQLQDLIKLQTRKDNATQNILDEKGKAIKPLTAKMEEELKQLVTKRDAPFELPQTAKSYIEKVWLKKQHGYDDVVITNQLMKGLLCEQDGIKLVQKLCKSKEFRVKNKERFENEFFTGCPDVLLKKEGIVEDIKNCYTVRTFKNKINLEFNYYAQVQVYMNLTGMKKARVHYCLVDTPEEIILSEELRVYYKFGCDEENKDYIAACEQIRNNHSNSHIEPKNRLKTFEVDYDSDFIELLKERVIYAREYYNTLNLGAGTYKVDKNSF